MFAVPLRRLLLALWIGHAASVPATALELPADEVRIGKQEQRRAGIRTQTVAVLSQPWLGVGRVVSDPRHRRQWVAPERGLILAPEQGFPVPGSVVKQGQLLGYLLPAMSLPERGELAADLALARRDLRDGRLKAERFNADEAEEIEISLPTPSLQILAEYRGAQDRERALDQAMRARIPLVAGSSGVLIHGPAQQSAVVAPGQRLFEWAPPNAYVLALRRAATATALPENAVAQAVEGRRLSLQKVAEHFDPETATRVAWYAVQFPSGGASTVLAEGEVLRVQAATPESAVSVISLPGAALQFVEGRHWVWTHVAAERFARIAVAVRVRGDGTAEVEGLDRATRVVIAGVSALRQRAAVMER